MQTKILQNEQMPIKQEKYEMIQFRTQVMYKQFLGDFEKPIHLICMVLDDGSIICRFNYGHVCNQNAIQIQLKYWI
tara:strand:- start:474 stop:701 length:228 start_codon:yes stop_codon:yes gene_type:complete